MRVKYPPQQALSVKISLLFELTGNSSISLKGYHGSFVIPLNGNNNDHEFSESEFKSLQNWLAHEEEYRKVYNIQLGHTYQMIDEDGVISYEEIK